MKLPEICICQPVLAIVLSLILVVLGILGFSRLELCFFPKLQMPIVSIHTSYQGASSDLMESQVTTVIENALAGLDNVQSISSSSSTSNSYITVQFRLGGDFEAEAAEVRDKVSGVREQLPTDADPPSITVGTKGAIVISLGFTDKNKSPADIRDYVERSVQPALRELSGVGEVDIVGASDYAMRIWLDSAEMAALGVTVSDVKTALTANNIYFPAGSIQAPHRNYGIVSNTRLQNATDFGNIIITQNDHGTIRFKDIAKVELGYRDLNQTPMLINGVSGVQVAVKPLQSANPITVADEVKAAVTNLKQNLPPGMRVIINYDVSQFLVSSIHETFMAIAEAIVLVIIVVFLFLGSVRATLIPVITIPVSLIGVFGIIYLLGFSINIMSLLGMVLAIGLVVDDAIVMLENIHRHIEQGVAPFAAAMQGSGEIMRAVIAMGVTLAAVYAPIGFVQGVTSELFKEFAFTLAGAVIISAFIALTLSPMMCSKILTSEARETRFQLWLDHGFQILQNSYRCILDVLLNKRIIVIGVLIAVAILGVLIAKSLPSEFLPQEDFGLVNVSMLSPAGANQAYTKKYTNQILTILNKTPAIKSYITQENQGSSGVVAALQPWGERNQTTQQVVSNLNPKFDNVTGITAIAYVPDIIDYGATGSDLTVNFMTAGDYQALLQPIQKLQKLLKNYPGVMDVDTNLKFDAQQYGITINRDLAAALGVNIQDIADTVSAMMSGNHWSDVQSGDRSYEVIVQMQEQDLKNFDGIKNLYVRSQTTNKMIPLSSLIKLTPQIGQGSLTHFNRLRSATVTALVTPGYTESEVIDFVNQHINSVLTPDIHYAYSGKAQQFIQSQGSMSGILLLAFVFIYLVLSAQFGSFIDPFIILLAVPLSMVGGLLALKLANGTLNLYSQIGIVTLIGLISKHGILITQFINELRQQGENLREAILQGAVIRLRPILMTTAAMVFGTLPLALDSGPGSVGRHQIGWVIVGGLICGTFFSLIVVPVAYSYLAKLKKSPKNNALPDN